MPRISLIRLISITIVLSIAINEKRFVEAFLEGFAASISKMNEQLTKFMEGIQKNVDLWSDTVIEHAKDEECLFVCPKGQQAFPKENSSSTATNQTRGCITFGIKIKDDDLPSKTMRECCNQQQICYHQCNVAKTKCENEFQECLRKKCHDISQDQKQFMGLF